ncbi:MAG: iron ABC transporter permease [Gammaproteobacteria bacterium]|nr:iron ABC transporter permease [Gammaproteobacteria bacterium]MDH3535899.1 iron ABC transporter permease [Gammaproteobacteria bacterium]
MPGVLLVATLFSLPLFTIVGFVMHPANDVWQHLLDTVLAEYLFNSAVLMLGVAIGTLVIGVGCAWLTSLCVFPGKKLFAWALLLPLAFPTYIIAYTYTGMFDFAGPVQTWIREASGWGAGDYLFPEIRSLGGAVTMFSLVLYPYVYLLARAAFLEQSVCVLEVSRTLGCSVWSSFYRVALPLARPAIVAGLSLALMETLADYGAVAYFGLGVFTTGIFRTWFGLGDSVAAAKLAAILLLFVFTLIAVERWSRKRAQYHHATYRYRSLPQYRLRGFRALAAFCACFLPLLLGFLLPAWQLARWALETYSYMIDASFLQLTLNSLRLASSAALLAVALALFLAYGKRLLRSKTVTASIRVVATGYAVPGTVVAVGVIIPFAWFDNSIDGLMRAQFGFSSGLLLSGSLFAVMFAYMVRFLAVSIQAVESGLLNIKPSMDDAARSLSYPPSRILLRVHLPLMKGTVLTALLIVFVDVMKELPATLILRPFNFNTLAVRAFELASDERLADSSTAALTIVAAGLLPVILLSYSISASRAGS